MLQKAFLAKAALTLAGVALVAGTPAFRDGARGGRHEDRA